MKAVTYEGDYKVSVSNEPKPKVNGRAKLSKIIAQHIRIEEAPQADKRFEQRANGYTKMVIQF